ncbi:MULTISPECIES: polyamine aminopropyltransferase [unclassified Streptomyces]|uniref:polyamine aminopropyltransferase n=1 Tax=unclassified Streptomyces TaxID=2593676 RepID=UPI00081EC0F9|nr:MULTISPECIES: polyamine aminopropyltransferase [unclassified Streptomyces]MYZ37663.1 polyamine aminopropyltransferase [Streptomyces sp. SID4917]SCF93094.1 spermidine synthase [Streptomyces sp. MnatMP-M17]
MIEQAASSPSQGEKRLPVRADAGRFLILAVVFICAACGLVYELELVALASYLIGDSVTQASVVLSVMVFAMGVGSLLAKRLRCRAAVGFGLLEAALALLGGCSALVLYGSFVWMGESRYALVGFSLAIGILIGAEIPLLMTLIQRFSRQDAEGTVADLFAADYVGALVGGLAFPFLLLPWLGQLTGALLTGAVNAVAGGALVLWLFRRDLTPRSRWLLVIVNVLVLSVLATAAVLVDDFERAARRAVYGDRVRVAVHTDVQEVVLTGGRDGPLDLYLDGRLRVSGRDEFRYHEALVHPAMRGPHAHVLILGGGDGLAAREVLRYGSVRAVTVVELDPGVARLARTDPALAALNGHAYDDSRLRAVYADAFTWLREAPERTYDVVISDLPNPGITASTKLYSEEFYGLATRVLTDRGRLAVHAGSPTSQPRTYWTVDATLRAAGFGTTPYSATGPPTGFTAGPDRVKDGTPALSDWGFELAELGSRPQLGLAADAPRLRSLGMPLLAAGARGVERTRIPDLPPSTLVHPRYTE